MKSLEKELRKYSSAERKKSNGWFFKTGKGEYGEGDIFIGVSVSDIRTTIKNFLNAELSEIEKDLHSPFHEVRLAAILVLVEQNKKARKEKNIKKQRETVGMYLRNKKGVNNWDIVDLSAQYILGQAILDGLEKESILDVLARSKNMWERRMAIIATHIFIREGKFDATIRLSRILLKDKEDLMHKAVGWMLRELWKKDAKIAEKFLITQYRNIPRTTLRYAIERMPEPKRKKFLAGMT